MRIVVPREVLEGERRVAASPSSTERLISMGFEVVVESGAGEGAGFMDADYRDAGAEIESDVRALWENADVVLKVRAPMENPELGVNEQTLLREGAILIGLLRPAASAELLGELASAGLTSFALESVPRISRAQKMDVLSSMANIVGYRGVIEAANCFGGFFTGQITAAGKVPPAKVLVIGAGVAGLAAIGTARSLGAVVRAFDTREAVRDEVRSLGAEFLELEFEEDGTGEGGYAKMMSPAFIEAEMKLFADQAKEVDIIVTAALVAGAKAPILVNKHTVSCLKPGSVIVDLAAAQKGNCELTVPGEVVVHNGVKIIGYTDLASRMSRTASTLLSNNLVHLVDEVFGGKAPESLEDVSLDLENEVIRGALVTHQGEVTWPPPRPEKKVPKPAEVEAAQKSETSAAEEPAAKKVVKKKPRSLGPYLIGLAGLAVLGVGAVAPATFLAHFSVFVLAIFVGWQVVWSVTAALHTPLMSVTNAISGIILIAGMLQISGEMSSLTTILGVAAVFVAMLNISGGFLVTHRMLAMFRRD